uniref:HSF-type DNA-binding domain-containing protein n=1 Tax=Entomoneis paludosa TaxID=265537 RepID=A0A7S2YLZ9_9STRA|mmetsp:Transcript_38082/g.79176  ORF Transcript_38082/g.79176 Transcript_38082/m.79176 type:complete len:400 (+) Transcript_38082:53-1252(+)
MCVTNTTYRRTQPISLPQQQQQSTGSASLGCPSGLTQRLMGTFQLTVPAKPQGGLPHMATTAAPVLSSQPGDKPRPKRRRKPQKPGKTAKMNDRHFVVHNYHDHANDTEDMMGSSSEEHHDDEHARRKGGVAVAFPLKLHAILDQVEQDGLAHVISWQAHGRCFVIHQPKEFVDNVMPKYFRQTKLTSFQRQLNLYGFCRLTRGADSGGYYHELFLRGKPFLCKRMIRTKVKGTKFKAASSPDQEPDFYTMPSVVVTPAHSRHSSPQHQPFVSSDESSSGSVAPAPMAPSHDFANMFSNSLQQQNQQQQLSFEPFPFQQQQQQFVPQMQMPVAFAPPVSNPADQVLDDAVNELFLNTNNMASEMNDLDDFVRDWEPDNFARSLDNDVALGFMLDKLLED